MAINTNHSTNTINGGNVLFEDLVLEDATEVTGSSVDLSDGNGGNLRYKNVAASVTLTFDNPPTVCSFLLQINYTSGVVTLPTITWVNGTSAPTFAAGSWVIPLWTYDGGTTWYGRGD